MPAEVVPPVPPRVAVTGGVGGQEQWTKNRQAGNDARTQLSQQGGPLPQCLLHPLPPIEIRYTGLSLTVPCPTAPAPVYATHAHAQQQGRGTMVGRQGAQAGAAAAESSPYPTTSILSSNKEDAPVPPPPNIARDAVAALGRLWGRVRGQDKEGTGKMQILHGISGVLRPGTSTLIIAAPGAGSTQFLRLLSGRVQADDPSGCCLLYNGRTRGEVQGGQGTQAVITRLAAYTPESDQHEALLTVRETFAFITATRDAHVDGQSRQGQGRTGGTGGHTQQQVGQPEVQIVAVQPTAECTGEVSSPPRPRAGSTAPLMPTAAPAPPPAQHTSTASCTCAGACAAPNVEAMLATLRLEEAADTIVGSAMIRGISGGQKRRVSIGETLLLHAPVLCLDSITNGLDASTAEAIVRHVCTWARQSKATVIMALQQPSPEILSCFDDLLLLSVGHVLYHGPVARAEEYWAERGYTRPAYMDQADFASQIVADPARAAVLSLEDRGMLPTQAVSGGADGGGGMHAAAGAGAVFGDTATQMNQGAESETGSEPDSRDESQATSVLHGYRETVPTLLSVHDLAAAWKGSPSYASLLGHTPAMVQEAQARTGKLGAMEPEKLPSYASTLDVNTAKAAAAPVTGGVYMQDRSLQQRYGRVRPNQWKGSWALVYLLFTRQAQLVTRNRILLMARFLNSLLMGAILATLFINPDPGLFQLRFGLALFSCIFIGFTNNAEVPAALLSRQVVYRHHAAGLYNPYLYIYALVACSIPVAILADLVYANLVYWPTNFVPEADRFFFFLLVIFLVDFVMGGYLRCLAYAAPTQERANAAGMGFISLWLLGAGFYIIRSQMPAFLAWIVWISPFFWAVVSVSNNEFTSDRYSAEAPGAGGITTGQLYLQQYDYPYGMGAAWGGVGFLFGLWALFTLLLTPLAISHLRHEYIPGTVRRPGDELSDPEAVATVKEAHAAKSQAQASPVNATRPPIEAQAPPAPPSTQPEVVALPQSGIATAAAASSTAILFPPVSLAFRDLEYDVRLPNGTARTLLRGVHGHAVPGTLTALMGATGAGKTTLLDVLAWRKTSGTTRGSITINGARAIPSLLARVSAYAEQEDTHMPLATVQEALHFSAELRYIPYEPEEQRRLFEAGKKEGGAARRARRQGDAQARALLVARVLRVLELYPLRNRLVHSLSRGELKRLTIGVELASNPSLLYCDEPTSGLDSRQAATVMRVLRRVARTGRTVVCTIHQPSAQIFFAFDQLLLLAPGGYQVYFGPLGRHATTLVSYLHSVPAVMPWKEGINPGSWMLQVLEGTRQGEGEVGRADQVQPAVHSQAATGSREPEVAGLGLSAGTSAGQGGPSLSNPGTGTWESHVSAHGDTHAVVSLGRDETQPMPDTSKTSHPFSAHYWSSTQARENERKVQELMREEQGGQQDTGAQGQRRYTATQRSWPMQLWQVYKRANVDYARNNEVFWIRLGVNCFLGLLFGLLFINNDLSTFSGTQSVLGFILGGTAFASIIFMSSGQTLQFERRGVFYRERAARYYAAPAYSLSAFLVELPYTAVIVLIFVAISYWIAGLRGNAGAFFFFWLGAWILSLFFMAVAVTYVALFPSLPVAQILGGLTISCAFLFAGLFAPASEVPAGWKGMLYAVPTSHILRALSVNQFWCVGGAAAGCPQISTVNSQGTAVVVDRFAYVTSFLAVPAGEVSEYPWEELGYALAGVGVLVLIGMLALQFINHQKR